MLRQAFDDRVDVRSIDRASRRRLAPRALDRQHAPSIAKEISDFAKLT